MDQIMNIVNRNETIADKWFDAFNHHQLSDLLDLYDDNAIHYSPKLKIKFPETLGLIKGKEALGKWWQDSFSRLPGLHYEVKTITANNERVFMEYLRQAPGEEDFMVAEVLVITNGKIIKSTVYHSS